MTTLPKPNNSKVLVIGWDAADWRVIRPLIASGQMPHLKKMMDDGVSGNISTLNPMLSPTLWTSIATGKRPYKHGIHGFSEPSPDGETVRPITNVNRSVKAVWNMLNQVGKKANVVAWWPSHPAEPIDGVMVSNWYQQARQIKNAEIDDDIGRPRPDVHGWTEEQWPLPPGTVHPERLARNLQEFRFHPMELTPEHVGPFVPRFTEVDQKNDTRLTSFAKILADTVSVHGAATALMQLEPWDLMAVYYDGIDHFAHGFMKYHPPRQEFISEEDFEMYKDVITGGYRFHDMMLGAMLALVDDDTTVIVLSDHGFHPDHLRLAHLPTEPAGPAQEHREFGILVATGPGIRKGAEIHGASVLDLTPTVLSIFGLPVGADMDGKPLVTIFETPPTVSSIPSWEEVEGPFPHGMHAAGAELDSVQSAEAIKQLVDLGYIEEPDEDSNVARRQARRELDYNLAQAYLDGGQVDSACAIFEQLWNDYPREHRFGFQYIRCLTQPGQIDERGLAIERMKVNLSNAAEWAVAELDRLRPEAEEYGISLPRPNTEVPDGREPSPDSEPAEDDDADRKKPPQKLVYTIRQVLDLLQPRHLQVAWLEVQQAFVLGDLEPVKAFVESILEQEEKIDNVQQLLMIARYCRHLDRIDDASRLTRRALEIDDENADVQLELAEIALSCEAWSEAVDHALESTELRFQNPRAHVILGTALESCEDFQNAEVAFGVAANQHPGNLDVQRRLLALAERRGSTDEAAQRSGLIAEIEKLRGLQAAIEDDRVDEVGRFIGEARLARRSSLELRSPIADDVESSITIVSGLPRSGTSMMMQMLQAGGLPAFTDAKRVADSDNPRGYLEHEKATQLARDGSWIADARGHAVKIVAQLLLYLPQGERYRVILMDRDIREVVGSQAAMLDRLGRSGGDLSASRMMNSLDTQLAQVERHLARRDDIDVCIVSYDDALADPAGTADRIVEFLGVDLDREAMAAAVDAGLRRQETPTRD